MDITIINLAKPLSRQLPHPNKDVETVDEVCSVERVSADPHTESLSQANLEQQVVQLKSCEELLFVSYTCVVW